MTRKTDAAAGDKAHHETVQSFERGIAVVRAFGPGADRLTLAQIAQRSNMPAAAARRFLHTLVNLGYAGSDGRFFFLRPRVLEMGYAYLASLGWWNHAHPHIQRVAQQTGESCSACVLDGTDVFFVARAVSLHIMTATLNIGSLIPAHATSLGRAILAWLPPDDLDAFFAESDRKGEREKLTPNTKTSEDELRAELYAVRQQGYSLVDQELEIGVRSVAVPLLSRSGHVVASIGVSAFSARTSIRDMKKNMLPPLLDAAKSIGPAIIG